LRILNENKTVYQLYKDLVSSDLVPADEFWSKFVDFDKLIESTKKQTTGVSGSFLVMKSYSKDVMIYF